MCTFKSDFVPNFVSHVDPDVDTMRFNTNVQVSAKKVGATVFKSFQTYKDTTYIL